MATQIKRRRGTTSQHSTFTGASSELTVDTDKNTVVVHDNSTAGGHPLAKEGWLSVEPHIIPDVLYPAISGNDLSGTALGGSYVYGTAHTDERKYYYTDIKGSKPIKDPRIGAHFGSQRHKTKSLQLLEQETATQGENIYSVDGREWCRGHLGRTSYESDFAEVIYLEDTSNYIEIVGYFSDANIIFHNIPARRVRYTLDGTDDTTDYAGQVAVTTPLAGRYVEAGGVENLGLGATLGIHTLKLRQTTSGHSNFMVGFELIAQDTSNRNNIQIPSQNVVSYGKKHEITATSQHYDPFNGFTNGTSLHSAFVDTDTSLGLDTAPGSSAKWAISSTNHIRPYQGGRVVKWVDSDGTIKTSVNMMPPNAQNISTTADSEITTPSATNTNYKPAFSDDAVDHSQAEVAKTFHFREFGNGSANGNASYTDLSTLTTSIGQTVAYVMDDGLTSSTGALRDGGCSGMGCMYPDDTGDSWYITFIGTGFTVYGASGIDEHVQNLPYGTHVVKYYRDAPTANSQWTIDGVNYYQAWGNHLNQVTFHQPKRPPIPEDACVIADYMLMADFVPQTSAGTDKISKGVRVVSCSRDVFSDETDGDALSLSIDVNQTQGFFFGLLGGADSDTSMTMRLPSFGTNYVQRGYKSDERVKLYIDTTDNDSSATKDNTASYGSYAHLTSNLPLGVYKFGANAASGQNGTTSSFEIATPIHTSSHYQTFETPFLHELVGGDRNMEQTNLVVTPDGKTWDEVTRDVSYLGPSTVFLASRDGGHIADAPFIFDTFRGKDGSKNFRQKNIAIAYDRMIILKDGYYKVSIMAYSNVSAWYIYVLLNTTSVGSNNGIHIRGSDADNQEEHSECMQLKRGDYLYTVTPTSTSNAIHGTNTGLNHLYIEKLD